MKSFFSLPLSQKLASLGITSESGMWWSDQANHYSEIPKWEIVSDIRSAVSSREHHPAFSMSDVFHKEALERLFPGRNNKGRGLLKWITHRDRMIEIYSEEGLPALEKYLEENL